MEEAGAGDAGAVVKHDDDLRFRTGDPGHRRLLDADAAGVEHRAGRVVQRDTAGEQQHVVGEAIREVPREDRVLRAGGDDADGGPRRLEAVAVSAVVDAAAPQVREPRRARHLVRLADGEEHERRGDRPAGDDGREAARPAGDGFDDAAAELDSGIGGGLRAPEAQDLRRGGAVAGEQHVRLAGVAVAGRARVDDEHPAHLAAEHGRGGEPRGARSDDEHVDVGGGGVGGRGGG